jgi:hypothetical protein
MKNKKPFWDTLLNPILMKEYVSWETEKDRKENKLKRKEMRKQKQLSTGIVTTEKRKGKVIEILVQNNDYDCIYDQCTLETELANNTELLLINMFK